MLLRAVGGLEGLRKSEVRTQNDPGLKARHYTYTYL